MKRLQEIIHLPIEIGDTVLGGKFRNHKIVVKDIGVDEIGQPTINGKSIMKIRIAKTMKESSMHRLQKTIRRYHETGY